MGHRSGRYSRPAGSMLGLLIVVQQILSAQGVANVLLVVNDASPLSRDIGQYYASRRGLLGMVSRRRRLLDYVKRINPEQYLDLLRRLEIRK